MSNTTSQMMQSLRRLNTRADDTSDKIADFNQRQMNGEKPDPNEFSTLLEQRANTHDAMRAQFKLLEKPIKTVLQETK